MRRIVLTSTESHPFVLDDRSLLSERYDVELLVTHGLAGGLRVLAAASGADLTICWFATTYSWPATLGARLAGKKSIIIVGGVDAAAMPEYEYGIWRSEWKGRIIRRALGMADAILSVDQRLLERLRTLSGMPLPQGIVLPTGYDTTFWTPSDQIKREAEERRGVLCVAACNNQNRAMIKGIDLYVEAAASLPEIPFTLVGLDATFVAATPFSIPPNVTLIERLERPLLRDLYRTHQIYCQPSRHEGLSNVLCEAMLCGMIPVGTDVGGTAEAIGETGIVVEPGNADALRDGILRGLDLSRSKGEDARARIQKLYPIERRRRELFAIIDRLLAEGHGED